MTRRQVEIVRENLHPVGLCLPLLSVSGGDCRLLPSDFPPPEAGAILVAFADTHGFLQPVMIGEVAHVTARSRRSV
jgi:hypothetical protein